MQKFYYRVANILRLVLIGVFFMNEASFAQTVTSLWQTRKSEHFIVYYQSAPYNYVEELLKRAEEYYQDITAELGFTRFDEFWTWDKRAKIYLFNDKEKYTKATNQPAWSGAGVDVYKREIYAYINMENFFDITLPHEMGHVIFREFIGYKRKLPLWLDEGIACYLEKEQRPERLLIARALVNTTSFMDMEELGKMKRVSILMPDIFYAESASIIDFLLATYGKEKFVEFCNHLRKLLPNQDWTVAFTEVYKLKDLSELNVAWQKFLRAGERKKKP